MSSFGEDRPDYAGHVDDRGFETLRAEFVGADLPRHLALFYESPDLQLTVAGAFVEYVLREGRRCLYLYDDNTRESVTAALRAGDIDVDSRIADGDLRLESAESAYLDADFDPDRLLGTLDEATSESIDDGYEGLGVIGENTWCFHTAGTFDRILEFEAQFDEYCPDLPVVALCQYDLTSFSEESIAKALWTHEMVIYRGRLCENPYYIPPERYTDAPNAQLNARLMLEQTYDLAQAQQRIRQREQRLAVLNRTLRHNIRNDLNVISGNLELLADGVELSATEREWLTAARQRADAVVEMADKARHVERTLSNSRVEPTEIESILDDVVAAIKRECPSAEVTTTGDRQATVLADTNLDVALLELATNAIEHQDDDTPTVTFDVDASISGSVHLEVSNPGESIPATDRRALREGRETPLEHGSGIGLWIVKWVVEEANGTLYFPNGGGECRIGIELPRVRK